MADTFEFAVSEGEALTLETVVYQAIGAASSCWESLEHTGVFQEDQARQIADALLEFIRPLYDLPLLGLATTREMLKELEARMAGVDQPRMIAALHHVRRAYATLTDDELDYRTAGDDHG